MPGLAVQFSEPISWHSALSTFHVAVVEADYSLQLS